MNTPLRALQNEIDCLQARVAALEKRLAGPQLPPSRSSVLITIRDAVAAACEITIDQMAGRSNKVRFVEARFLGCWLSRQITDATFEEISTAYGYRDHGGAFHAAQRGQELMDVDPKFHARALFLKTSLQTAIEREAA